MLPTPPTLGTRTCTRIPTPIPLPLGHDECHRREGPEAPGGLCCLLLLVGSGPDSGVESRSKTRCPCGIRLRVALAYGADTPLLLAYGADTPLLLAYGADIPLLLAYEADTHLLLAYGADTPLLLTYGADTPLLLAYGLIPLYF